MEELGPSQSLDVRICDGSWWQPSAHTTEHSLNVRIISSTAYCFQPSPAMTEKAVMATWGNWMNRETFPLLLSLADSENNHSPGNCIVTSLSQDYLTTLVLMWMNIFPPVARRKKKSKFISKYNPHRRSSSLSTLQHVAHSAPLFISPWTLRGSLFSGPQLWPALNSSLLSLTASWGIEAA